VDVLVEELVELLLDDVDVDVLVELEELDVDELVELEVEELVVVEVVVVVTHVPVHGFGPGLSTVPNVAAKSHVSELDCRVPSPQIVQASVVFGSRHSFVMPGGQDGHSVASGTSPGGVVSQVTGWPCVVSFGLTTPSPQTQGKLSVVEPCAPPVAHSGPPAGSGSTQASTSFGPASARENTVPGGVTMHVAMFGSPVTRTSGAVAPGPIAWPAAVSVTITVSIPSGTHDDTAPGARMVHCTLDSMFWMVVAQPAVVQPYLMTTVLEPMTVGSSRRVALTFAVPSGSVLWLRFWTETVSSRSVLDWNRVCRFELFGEMSRFALAVTPACARPAIVAPKTTAAINAHRRISATLSRFICLSSPCPARAIFTKSLTVILNLACFLRAQPHRRPRDCPQKNTNRRGR
jgi:hypothetical protein